jgi:DNA-binding XRE family transcriptional regulator
VKGVAPKLLVVRGRALSVKDWAAEAGVSPFTLYGRLRNGESPEDAVGAARPAGRPSSGTEMWDGARQLRYADDLVAQTLVGVRAYTQQEVADMLGVTRQRAQQLEEDALKAFARRALSMGLTADLCGGLVALDEARDARAARWPVDEGDE